MTEHKEHFADDLANQDHKHYDESTGTQNHNDLEDKWNEIQDEYIASIPELETEDLYFEGGGFNGMLQKMSEITGKSVKEIRNEIENW
ncbi:hypothetical protein SAMN03097699_2802 [Flavobacteriaceae bacterium MAR_2010_188]|nr:hypothetical protein SAMN03097699_2802 [Flavobacteriaceae bacterium MAR_2010_188]